jgi:ABC-type transport system involved in cytochrome bd biosynthesis, fused ATPase and permease components
LDSQVSKKVLEDCFLGYLRDKTRILITHKLECLPLTDFIYIMKDGKIVHEGPYSALKECEALLQLQQKIRPKEKPEEVIEETPENLDEVFEQIKEEEKDSDDEDSDQSQEKEKRNDEKSILKKTKEQDLDLIIKESSQGDVTLQTLKLLAQHLGGRKSIFFLFASKF